MGLDMYMRGRVRNYCYEQEQKEFIDGFEVIEKTLELAYWRKHPNLHGFIVDTFGNGEDDCTEIPLEPSDLKAIITAIKKESLPHTEGFFFGSSDGTEKAEDIELFTKALAWVEDKKENTSKSVYYRASW